MLNWCIQPILIYLNALIDSFLSGAMMKKPSRSHSFFTFLSPFTTKLWIFILISVIAIGITMVLVTWLSDRSHRSSCRYQLCMQGKPKDEENKLQVSENLWFLLSTLVQQGSSFEPK